MEKEKYFIGLDIGTDSLGYAVINSEGKLKKYKNKNMWGVRLFEGGATAQERRKYRSQRRRIERRSQRINNLQKLFEPEILKVDTNFFMKLEESFLIPNDKLNSNCYNLFCDKNFTDVDYFDLYPTIYHLRYALMNENKKFDIRLVYLACHNLIKYRGNFIKEGQEFNINDLDFSNAFRSLFEEMYDLGFSINIVNFDSIDFNMIEEAIVNDSFSKVKFSSFLSTYLDNVIEDKKISSQLAGLLSGRTTDVSSILGISDITKITFDTDNFDEEIEKISNCDEELQQLVLNAKELYDMIVLKKIFKNTEKPSISKMMIDRYNKNANDLKLLKKLCKSNLSKSKYNAFFKDKDCILNLYMKNTGKLNYDEFKKKIKQLINEIDVDSKNDVINELEKNDFLKKLNSTENGVFPYQLQLEELRKIIANQSKYYPFLLDCTDKGENKIELLLKFRIPYYVGPLNLNADSNGNSRSFAWISKKKDEKITPFNFEDVVDTVKSAENFITRMTNFCTYLTNEKVLPKNSLIYTKYMVISELKQIRVNNHKLNINEINTIIEDLFIKTGKSKITKNDLIKFLKFLKFDVYEVTGFQKEDEFATNMKVYKDFIDIFGSINEKNFDMIENLIKWITVFEDKKILALKIKDSYPNLDNEIVTKVVNKNYRGWGRLSRQFLLGETGFCYQDDFSSYSIMDLLTDTDENLMQILNNRNYDFETKIKDYNSRDAKYDIDALNCSPAIKKGVRQSMKLVDEIIGLLGYNPEHIFIEMTRSDNKSERSINRNNQLLKLYDLVKKQACEYNDINYDEIIEKLNSEKYEKIDDTRLYLYFIQHGKCMYTGQSLNINELNSYEVDHIIPRSLIKDDSLDNLALVVREANQRKADGLTLSIDIVQKQYKFWEYLYKNKFISSKKFYNLCRKEFSDKDIEGFINRQFVETSQIIKNVVQALNCKYGEDVVVSIKASLSSNYRKRYALYKFRQLNDFHHAKDAYLAACLGNYLLLKYPDGKNNFIYSKYKYVNYFDERRKKYNPLNNYGFILDNMEKPIIEEDVVILDTDTYIKNINRVMLQNDVLISKKVEMYTGAFYNQTLYSKDTKTLIPRKNNLDPHIYGGYSGANEVYSMLVEYNDKNKIKRKVLGLPYYIYKLDQTQKGIINDYIQDVLGVSNFKIIKDKICKNSLIIYKGQLCYLCSSKEVCNATQLKLTVSQSDKFNILLNYICNDKLVEGYDYENDIDEFINILIEKFDKYYPIYENVVNKLKNNLDKINDLSLSLKKEFVLQILKMLRANSENANLKLIGLTEREGRIRINCIDSGVIINDSISGIKENKYEF